MPEPDVMVVRGDLRQYRERLPRAEDVGLIVEVADATLYRDQEFKTTIYAQAGIPVYWLVNLIDNRIEVYSEPAGSGVWSLRSTQTPVGAKLRCAFGTCSPLLKLPRSAAQSCPTRLTRASSCRTGTPQCCATLSPSRCR